MQNSSSQKFLICRHRRDNFYSLHRVDYVREAFSATFRASMGLDRKNNSLIKN